MAIALFASAALAAEPRCAEIVMSDVGGGPAMKVFRTTTPRIHLDANLVDVPSGATVRSEWIAEKVAGLAADYRIDAVDVKVGPLMNSVSFSYGRPKDGWPPGDYRVELLINNKPAGQARFIVAKTRLEKP